ncbi:MAG: ATP-binding protein, partial [Gammaproteobacteria bacterium]
AALDLIRTAGEGQPAPSGLGPLGIGVTTGSVYCGVVGSEIRSHYSLVGEPMNLAAALMCAAETGVLCDEASALAVGHRLTCRRVASVHVKGHTEPIPVFVPVGPASEPGAPHAGRLPLYGRAEECARLDRRLHRLARRQGGLVWIEGEPGIGKSRLLAYLLDRAKTEGMRIGVGSGEAIERHTLYHAWRAALRTALSSHPLVEAIGPRAAVVRWAEEDPRFAAWVPLLEPLLLVGLEETEITRQIVGAARADATAELLVHVLRQLAVDQSMLLAFDDAHWIDSASWTLVAAVVRRAQELLVVVGARPLDAAAGVELDLRNHPDTERLQLGPLPTSAVVALVASGLGVRSLPGQLERFLVERAGGNPFFSEEISRALRDRGIIRIEGEECYLASGMIGEELSDLPSTVQGVITARFDRLSPDEQLVLKVASTIGRSFSLDLLAAIHPVASQRSRLPEMLRYLASLDLASLQPGADEAHYAFKHAITQDVVYGVMTPSQKRNLHAAIAGWYEMRHRERLEPHFALLAFHWRRAQEPARAIVYLVRAGEQALAQHANAEAVQLLSDALRLDGTIRVSVPAERARWESQLADAYLKLSEFEACRRHALESLHLLGHRVPASHHAQLMLVPIEWIRHSLRRVVPASGEVHADERRLIAHLHQQRAEVAFFDHDHSSLLHAAARCLNESEALGVSTELAYACGTVAIVAGIAGLHRLARTYLERSLRVAAEVRHLPTVAYVNQLASVYYNGLGDWAPAEANICEAAELFNRLGDSYRWQSCLMIRAYQRMYRGDFTGVDELVEKVWPLVFPEGVAQVRAWCFSVHVFSTLPRRALDRLELAAGEEVIHDLIDTSEQILVRGALALVHARSGRSDEARRQADTGTELIERFPPTTYYTMAGVAAVTEAYLELWAEASAADLFEARDLANRARAACAHLRRFARKFPFAVPRTLLLQGLRDVLLGRPRRAATAWRQCAEEAARRGMPYERGLALALLGRPGGDRTTEREQGEGRALLEKLGARRDLERLATAAPALGFPG